MRALLLRAAAKARAARGGPLANTAVLATPPRLITFPLVPVPLPGRSLATMFRRPAAGEAGCRAPRRELAYYDELCGALGEAGEVRPRPRVLGMMQ